MDSNCDIVCPKKLRDNTLMICLSETSVLFHLINMFTSHLWVLLVVLLFSGNLFFFHGNLVFQNRFAIFVEFFSLHDNAHWILTNIYAPCSHPDKREFLQWFKSIDMPDTMDWLIVGDFNLCRSPDDRNQPGGSYGYVLV